MNMVGTPRREVQRSACTASRVLAGSKDAVAWECDREGIVTAAAWQDHTDPGAVAASASRSYQPASPRDPPPGKTMVPPAVRVARFPSTAPKQWNRGTGMQTRSAGPSAQPLPIM